MDINELEQCGIRISEDAEKCKLAAEKLARIAKTFSDELEGLEAVCLFQNSEQAEDFRRTLGLAQDYEPPEGKKLYAVLLSVDALLLHDEDYAAALLCHELAHVQRSLQGGPITDHGRLFRKQFRKLIRKWYHAGGGKSETDFSGKFAV